ncbi:BIRC4 [Mytilus edulis]|uniref:XIAP n=1 Tax=Mytilus edulis TaxID=6550 RepID=A0A8S3TPW4_MYTED|nr:BIRC4 [Mytilus edulis]
MAMVQSSNTISVLFLACHGTKDIDWTRNFVHSLRQDGFQNIFSTTDFQFIGVNYFEELKGIIRKVQKILVVISKTSSRNPGYIHTISCIMAQLLNEQCMCDVVPLLLDEDVDMPFLLQCYVPFLLYAEDISKLEQCLFVVSEEQAVTEYVRLIIGLSVQENQLRRLNRLALPSSTSDQIKTLAMCTMQHWGVTLNDNRITVNMKELQTVSAYHRICLNDLFRHFHSDDKIRIIRLTGVKKFSFQTLFENGQVYSDLITMYRNIFTALTKDKRYRYWYQYRRNGLAPADGAELAYKPVNDAIAVFNEGKPHSPQFKTYTSRLQSLELFPIQSQKIRELIAECGFFSLKNLDYVQCFHCGICLRTWNIASTEHSF